MYCTRQLRVSSRLDEYVNLKLIFHLHSPPPLLPHLKSITKPSRHVARPNSGIFIQLYSKKTKQTGSCGRGIRNEHMPNTILI